MKYLQKCFNLNYDVNYNQVRHLAYEYALKNKQMPKKWTTKKVAGRDGMLNFMQRRRNKLSLRNFENTSLARINNFNKENVMEFL